MTQDPAARIAAEIQRRGLAAPARLLADAHRPLGPLLADLGIAVGGMLGAAGGRSVSGIRGLIEDGEALDRLVAALDEAQEPHAESR